MSDGIREEQNDSRSEKWKSSCRAKRQNKRDYFETRHYCDISVQPLYEMNDSDVLKKSIVFLPKYYFNKYSYIK